MTKPHTDRPYMPEYGISAAPDGQLPWSWARQRLTDAHNYWLATVDPDGAPHLAAVWAVWFDDALCFSTGGRSRKARNLAHDPRCTLSPEGAAESVVLRGTARRLTDPSTVDRLRTAYRAKYGSDVPDPQVSPVYAVAPRTVIGLIERDEQFTTSATRWTFGD